VNTPDGKTISSDENEPLLGLDWDEVGVKDDVFEGS
jgi:hypothetical protein